MSLLQNEDHKTEAELVAAGGSKDQLLNDTKIYVTAKSINETLDDAITLGLIGSSGTTNFVLNSDFEIDNSEWSSSDGTNVPISRITSGELAGSASLRLSKAASNESGDYVAGNITAYSGYSYRMLTLSFIYKTSANYADDDIRVRLYDVTNAAYIDCADGDLKANEYGIFTGQFQLTDSTSYQVRLYIVSTNATAYTVDIDDVEFGPKPIVYGAPVTDWESYTPTFTNLGTPTGVDFSWRRVGTNIEVNGYFTTGTVGSGQVEISLPTGIVVDTSRTNEVAGNATIQSSSPIASITYIKDSTHIGIATIDPSYAGLTGTQCGSSHFSSIQFSGEVVGWSSNVQMSENAGLRDVIEIASSTSGQAINNNDTIIWDNSYKSTHGALNTSNGIFTAPYTGVVDIDCIITSVTVAATVGNNFGFKVVVSSPSRTIYSGWDYCTNTASRIYTKNASMSVDVYKGSTIQIQFSEVFPAVNLSTAYNIVNFKMRAADQTIAATESVYVKCQSSSGQSIPHNTDTIVKYETSVRDTHNAYNTSTGYFTAPYSKFYYISSNFSWANITNLNYCYISLWVNSSLVFRSSISESGEYRLTAGQGFYLNKGDTLAVGTSQNDSTSAARALAAGAGYNHLTIFSIG